MKAKAQKNFDFKMRTFVQMFFFDTPIDLKEGKFAGHGVIAEPVRKWLLGLTCLELYNSIVGRTGKKNYLFENKW